MVKRFIISVLLLLSSIASAVSLDSDRPWLSISDPNIMSSKFIRVHDQLPLKGIVKNQQNFWSGDYWAIKLGNINYRWNQPVPAGFHLDSPSKKRLLSMTLEA